ncbi:MAG: hypothetical protein AAGL17_15615 [Cyanobacteria bacterium J06576_12]
MTSERTKKQPAVTVGSSPAQTIEVPQKSAVVAEENDSSAAVPTGEQKPRKQRKKRKLPPLHQRRMVQALGRVEGRLSPVEGSRERSCHQGQLAQNA